MGFLSGVKIDLCTNTVANGFQTNSFNPVYSFNMGRSFVLPDMEKYDQMFADYFSRNNSYDVRFAAQNAEGKTTSAEVSASGNRNSIKGNGKLGAALINRVKEAAEKINCDYEDLLAIMYSESGINPACGLKSDGSVASAAGLVQFMDDGGIACLKQYYGINVTREQLVRMSAVEQMYYVEKLFLACKKAAGYKSSDRLNGPTLYALIFLPGRARRDVLCVKGETGKNGKLLGYYEQNPVDYDKDGDIDKKDLAVRIDKKHSEMKRQFFA